MKSIFAIILLFAFITANGEDKWVKVVDVDDKKFCLKPVLEQLFVENGIETKSVWSHEGQDEITVSGTVALYTSFYTKKSMHSKAMDILSKEKTFRIINGYLTINPKLLEVEKIIQPSKFKNFPRDFSLSRKELDTAGVFWGVVIEQSNPFYCDLYVGFFVRKDMSFFPWDHQRALSCPDFHSVRTGIFNIYTLCDPYKTLPVHINFNPDLMNPEQFYTDENLNKYCYWIKGDIRIVKKTRKSENDGRIEDSVNGNFNTDVQHSPSE